VHSVTAPRHARRPARLAGLLVVAGLAFLTGGMADFSVWLQSTFPVLTRLG